MVSGAQVRMARAGLKLRVRDLARSAGVSPNTVTRIEADLGGNASTLAAVRRALEEAGAVFLGDDQDGVGVRVPRAGAPAREAAWLRPEQLNSSNDG
jgi:transcriptional regulator with XRE-family HTH domain